MKKGSKAYFVTAIETDSGKTLVSAILCSRLNSHYWKSIQCGLTGDTEQIRTWMGNEWPVVPQTYRLKTPCSAHLAAKNEGLRIEIGDFKLPEVAGNLVVEGAGGLLVPINETEMMANLIRQIGLPIV